MTYRTAAKASAAAIGSLAWSGVALAQSTSTAIVTGTCRLNGQVVPCEQLGEAAGKAIGWGIGFLVGFLLVILLATVFWVMMLIHAATHPVQHRPMWILLMVFTGVLGAMIYWIAVKRTYGRAAPAAAAFMGGVEPSPIAPPVSPQLAEYVRASRASGVADDATRQSLVGAGWNAADVDRALKG